MSEQRLISDCLVEFFLGAQIAGPDCERRHSHEAAIAQRRLRDLLCIRKGHLRVKVINVDHLESLFGGIANVEGL